MTLKHPSTHVVLIWDPVPDQAPGAAVQMSGLRGPQGVPSQSSPAGPGSAPRGSLPSGTGQDGFSPFPNC